MQRFTDQFLAEIQTVLPQKDFYDEAWNGRGTFGVRLNRARHSKKFFLLYSIGGKRRRLLLGEFPKVSLEEARALALSVMDQVERGQDPGALRQRAKTEGKFSELCDRFLKGHRLAEKTAKEYRRIIEKELLPVFGTRIISQITLREIRALLFSLGEEKPALANRVRGILSSLFDLAVEAGLCEDNVVLQIRPTIREAEKRISRGERRLSLEQLQGLFREAGELTSASKSLVQFALLSGVPIRTVENIQWKDVRGDYWAASERMLVFLTPYHRELMNLHSKNSAYIFSPDFGVSPFKNSRVTLQRLAKKLVVACNWSDISASIRFQMIKLGFAWADLSLVYGLNTVKGIDAPDPTIIERSAKRLFSDWAQIITEQGFDRDSGSNVVRMRRLKRLK